LLAITKVTSTLNVEHCNILWRLCLLVAEHRLHVVVAQFEDDCRLVCTLYNHLIPVNTWLRVRKSA